ncbi:MAG: sulfur transferase domain-containing protein [Tepidisphaeraceae bacterium]
MRQAYRAIVVFIVFLAAGCHTAGKSVVGISNFAKVDEQLSRGAQPTEAGIETLKIQGVRTVLNLRDDANPAEQFWVESRGLHYVRIPCNAAVVEPLKIRAFLEVLATAPGPIFVHCRRGRDRTGLDIAIYRIMVQGWDREAAIRELYEHGYNWAMFPVIVRYVRGFEAATFKPTDATRASG